MANAVPYTGPSGYEAATTVLQGDDEHPLMYYDRIFHAYFGDKREPGMEEDESFKFVFPYNLNSEIRPSVYERMGCITGTIEELKECAVTVFEAFKEFKMLSKVTQSERLQITGRWPRWLSIPPEMMGLWIGTRPKRKKDGNQGNPFFDEGSRQEPQTQKPAPPAPQAEQPETSRKPQESQEKDLEPLHSDKTVKLHSLFETLKSTDKDEQPGALCGIIIADNSESMNNNVPTVTDSQHKIVVTSSDSPISDERGVHSHTNDGDPSRAEHSDATATALMVRMDQNYTERGKRKKKRWPKPERFLCKVFFLLCNQLKLNKDSLTSAHGPTSSLVFVVPHDQRGVRLVHPHDLPSAVGHKAYYDQKASHEELQVGDKVWYYVFAPTTGKEGSGTGTLARKLMPRWTGPHLITDKLSSVVYQIKISKGQKEPIVKWVHWNQVKPYKASTDSAGDKDHTNTDLVGKKVVQAGTN